MRAIPSLPNLRLLILGLAGGAEALLDVPARLPSLTELSCVLDAEHEMELRRRYPKLTVNGSWLTPEAVAKLGDDVAPLETNPTPSADVRPVELTADTWDEAISGDTPVLVDFWAAWCGPCRAIAPTIEALAPELAGRVTVAKLDVENEKGISERYGVMGIPALLLFRRGEQIAKIGGHTRERILEDLGKALAG